MELLDRCARDRTVYIDQFIAFNCLSLLNIIYKQLTSTDACNVSVCMCACACMRAHACMRACVCMCVSAIWKNMTELSKNLLK